MPFRRLLPLARLGIAGLALSLWPTATEANQDFYPPAPQAKSAIDLDGHGFIIRGKRQLIMSGSIHYPRVPHELWADRLLRLKQAGFNNVQTYAFWNYNEPRENQFNFTGDGDIGAFLSTAQRLGLTATVRPGPYVCAEWDMGGFPVWLRFKGDIPVRTDDPRYLALNDHWYGKIIPIIARHQINRGGNVILVQLENEDPKGWGVITTEQEVDAKDPKEKAAFLDYFTHLNNTAEKLGLEVPHFMSGQNHGPNPGTGNINPQDHKFPWITTEFWAGWFDAYRTLPAKRYADIDKAQWEIVAHGGEGYNFYMLHGGSNFETWNDSSVRASYDYGAAIGQAGDLRPMYYRMKRVNQLGGSFPDILADASDVFGSYRDFVKGDGIEVLGARQSDAGTLVFLRNSGNADALATFKTGETVTIPGNGTYPIPQNVALNDTARIADATVPILGMARNGRIVTAIVYGKPGTTGRVTLSGTEAFLAGKPSAGITANASTQNQVELHIKFPAQGVEECLLDQSGSSVRILAINEDLSLYTWILGDAGKQDVVLGPAFVQGLQEANGHVSLAIERPYGQAACGQVAVYGDRPQGWHLAARSDASMDAQPAPSLGTWQMTSLTEAAPEYDDSKWMTSDDPQQMGADGDNGCFVWYRTTIDIPGGGPGTLHLSGADEVRVYVNGKYVNGDRNVNATFVSGKNSVAVFVSHHGRPKLLDYMGSLAKADVKGLDAPVSLDIAGKHLEVKGWRMRGGLAPDLANPGAWQDLGEAHDVPTLFRTTFTTNPPGPAGAHPILRATFAGLSRGTMWINGHNLGQYPEVIPINGLYIPECWLKAGVNELTLFDTHGSSPSSVQLEVEKEASREVMRVWQPVNPATPMIVPTQSSGGTSG